jgi:hypothetical protein
VRSVQPALVLRVTKVFAESYDYLEDWKLGELQNGMVNSLIEGKCRKLTSEPKLYNLTLLSVTTATGYGMNRCCT